MGSVGYGAISFKNKVNDGVYIAQYLRRSRLKALLGYTSKRIEAAPAEDRTWPDRRRANSPL
jgi:hypothetical protein